MDNEFDYMNYPQEPEEPVSAAQSSEACSWE